MTKLTPNERKRRRALKLAKTYDFACTTCAVHEGHPCQNTSRAKQPGTTATEPHKYRLDRAFGYLANRGWDGPGSPGSTTTLNTTAAQDAWNKYKETL